MGRSIGEARGAEADPTMGSSDEARGAPTTRAAATQATGGGSGGPGSRRRRWVVKERGGRGGEVDLAAGSGVVGGAVVGRGS
ncbi:Os05g0301800 [Oryza sativa Japonica Group]|uniref:Os05g0301800 protein n=1 Tax=Oryza sativa subsp. japonica TaxID=39947 RepID=C7J302_ORYSJ|nr:Os05g0301800 [Oryza sativa Japonica Group]|eukprot:NP_001174333.1 Os05g0301800 [Oryza sativa Japonica Group]